MMPKQLPRMALAELRKLLSRGLAQLGFVVALLLGAFAVVALNVVLEAQGGITINRSPAGDLIQPDVATALHWALTARNFVFMPPVLLTLTAMCLAGEWQDRTLRPLVLRPVPRWSVIVAKVAALWSWSFLTLCLTYGAAFLGGLAVLPHELPVEPVTWGFLATALADLGLILIGLLVGTALQSVPAVIVATLLFLLADRALWLALQGAQLFGYVSAARLAELLPGTALGAWRGYDSAWNPEAFVALAALLILTGVVTLWRFERADVP